MNHFNDALISAPKATYCCEGFHRGYSKSDTQNAEVPNVERQRNKYIYISLAERHATKVADYHNEIGKLTNLKFISNMQARQYNFEKKSHLCEKLVVRAIDLSPNYYSHVMQFCIYEYK